MSVLNYAKMMTALGIMSGREFAEGWIEGSARYKAHGSPAIVPGSIYEAGTIRFAASQAAVAYHIGMEQRR